MAPFRRAQRKARPGSGERFRFRQTDGTSDWTVHFEGDDVRLTESTGPCDVEWPAGAGTSGEQSAEPEAVPEQAPTRALPARVDPNLLRGSIASLAPTRVPRGSLV